MKHIFIIVLFISFTRTKCHVANRTEYYEHTTPDYGGEETEINYGINEINDTRIKIEDKDINSVKSVDGEANGVYLDDVLFVLKSINWTEEENLCMVKIYQLVQSLQNFTLWAVWDWDAQASEPQGLLYGNRYQLGNFDQCMNAPWSNTHQELKMKYCLADIKLERTDKNERNRVDEPISPYSSTLDFIEYRPLHTRVLNELTWGACVPTACRPSTVEKLLGVMLARSHLGTAGIKPNISITEPCQSDYQQLKFDGLFYAFMSITGLLVVITLICTYLNYVNKETGHENHSNIYIKAFCLRENTNDLLITKKGGIEVFYGIKFLTICLIVLDHEIGISNAGPISDGLSTDKDVQSLLGLFMLHNDVFVDTFFFIGGFLTMASLCQMKKFPNIFLLVIKRYVRLIIGFGVMIFYVCAVYPYTGSGPLWIRAIQGETEQCRKNWWLNILMVQNYVDTENMCIIYSWYISCDFHFFVVTILWYWIYRRQQFIGKILAVAITITSIILPGIITYMYQLSAIQPFTIDFIINPRASKDFNVAYVKSHIRCAAYIVGLFSGYIFVKHNIGDTSKKISKKWATLASVAALIFMLGVMLSGSTFIWRDYYPLEGAIYAALNRPAWACGISLFILCCAFGEVPVIKGFLSWYPWVPLSRLAYGLYLTHTVIISRGVFVVRNPQDNDHFNTLTTAAGTIFWGCIAALFIWYLAEAPANKLLGLYLKSKIQKNNAECKTKPSEQYIKDVPPTSTPSIKYVYDNYSPTTHWSSKM